MAERARLGEGRERLSEVGCVAPGGVGLSSGAEGRRVGRGKALDQQPWRSPFLTRFSENRNICIFADLKMNSKNSSTVWSGAPQRRTQTF